MKITVQHLHHSFNRSYELKSPGATFGRSHDNQIALPDPSMSISLFQAAIKIKETGQIELRNLAATPLLVGNQSLRVGQSLEIEDNSEFRCGDFKFQLEAVKPALDSQAAVSQVKQTESPSFKAPTVMPMPGTEAMLPAMQMQTAAPSTPLDSHPIPQLRPQFDEITPETFEVPEIVEEAPVIEDTEFTIAVTEYDASIAANAAEHTSSSDDCDAADKLESVAVAAAEEPPIIAAPATTGAEVQEPTPSVFDDLFSGNGVVPIGAEPDYMEVHPFEIGSATIRNSSDPLNLVNGIELDEDLSKDPLERLSRDGIEHQQRDIFHDTRPSTMLHDNQDEDKTAHLDDLDKIFSELESYAKN